MKLFSTLVLALVLASPCVAQEQEIPPWLAKISSASGVVVHGDGWLFTAEHVVKGEHGKVDVEVAGKKYVGKVINEPPVDGIDSPTVVKIEATGLAYASVAKEPPAVGTRVIAFGYPNGKFARTEGAITRVGQIEGRWRLPGGYESDVFVQPGSSGGPLVNEDMEVVGLCHGVELSAPVGGKMVSSKWIGLAPMRALFAPSKKTKPTIRAYAFVQNGCAPCMHMKNDVAAGKYPDIEFVFVTRDDAAVMAKIQKRGKLTLFNYDGTRTTSTHLPNVSPCVWVEGTSNVFVGYSGVGSFVNFLKFCVIDIPGAVFQFVGDVIFGSPQPPPSGDPFTPIPDPTPVDAGEISDAGPPPQIQPTPEPVAEEPTIDWSKVTFVALVDLESVTAPKTKLGAQLAEQATGDIERAMQLAFGQPIGFKVVSQAYTPNKFGAVTSAANIRVDSVAVIALIAEYDLGIVKGAVAKRLEEFASSKLHGTRFDIVAERANPDTYAAIHAGLAVPETPVEPSEDDPWWYGTLAAILPMLRRYVDSLGKKKQA